MYFSPLQFFSKHGIKPITCPRAGNLTTAAPNVADEAPSDPMYQIVKVHTDNENGVEARLARIDNGYSVGMWDLDCEAYYPGLRIFPFSLENSLEMATEYFEQCIKPFPTEYLEILRVAEHE